MSDNDKKREIPIKDENQGEQSEAIPPQPPVAEGGTAAEKSVLKEQAAASVYQQQAVKESGETASTPPGKQTPEAKPATEEKAEKEPQQPKPAPEKEVGELRDKLLRLHAEFDNFRKRTERERMQIIGRATSTLLEDLLPVLDNFQLALNHDASNGESFRDGVKMIYRQMEEKLAKHGLEKIKAVGEHFDPSVHEALMTEQSAEHEEGDVIQELQAGYKLKGVVLRPARVKVASAPLPPKPPAEQETDSEEDR